MLVFATAIATLVFPIVLFSESIAYQRQYLRFDFGKQECGIGKNQNDEVGGNERGTFRGSCPRREEVVQSI
jgi:hypothetical protein